ncbi:DUF2567 domain-containing protein [Streptomyces sp. CAU 1734]|uniref:DUF2567 domain-containing protein n=1 Tax=Streptomyces sp. CAU 1734 TaxID=3140360 RepID=UPI00326011BD
MTAPLTPPAQPQQPHGSSDEGAPWPAPAPGPRHRGSGDPELRADLRDGALVTLAVGVSGVLFALLWSWLAPRVSLISDGKAVFVRNTEGEQAVGADGTFGLLALGFGVLSAAAVFWFRRRGGVPLVAGLALGGVVASLLAWRIGIWLGPPEDLVAHAKSVGAGVPFEGPLKLSAKGMLLGWSLAAMAVHLGLTAAFGPRDPEPEPPALWDAPPPRP